MAVSPDDIASDRLPIDRIYCGYIGWEYIQAQDLIGAENSCLIDPSAIPQSLLPTRIRSYTESGTITDHLKPLLGAKTASQSPISLKLALINGTGTMLGDTIVGASVLEHVVQALACNGIRLEIDVYCAWNARPGVEDIWQHSPSIHKVFGSSPTIAQLQQYDAYWDFSHLLRLQGYSTAHFGDFYFNHLGFDPRQVDTRFKLPTIRANRQAVTETQAELSRLSDGASLIFIQALASTPARSMPDVFLVNLIQKLARISGHKLVITGQPPKGLSNFERKQVIDLQAWTHNNLDRYLSVIAISQFVISVDTLALHVAMGFQKPGAGLFSLSEPEVRLQYSPQMTGIMIPNANSLPYWGKHKSDEDWEKHRAKYEAAWLGISIDQIADPILNSI